MPTVVPNELTFLSMSETDQKRLIGFELIREQEEVELQSLGVRI